MYVSTLVASQITGADGTATDVAVLANHKLAEHAIFQNDYPDFVIYAALKHSSLGSCSSSST
jgi:hypothetical protein